VVLAWFFFGWEWDGRLGARRKIASMIVLILAIPACDFDEAVVWMS
jgi:hypothetical protein